MARSESITPWLSKLREGNPEAAQRVWDRYFTRLVTLARKKLHGKRFGIADEEDLAISAIGNLCRSARDGHFPQLTDGDGLWRLLVVITARKALHLFRNEGRMKRDPRAGDGKVGRIEEKKLIEEYVGNEPTPQFAAQVTEEYQRLIALLDEDQRAIAIAKLEGLTNPEIAARINRSLRTVERKLQLIRETWEESELP